MIDWHVFQQAILAWLVSALYCQHGEWWPLRQVTLHSTALFPFQRRKLEPASRVLTTITPTDGYRAFLARSMREVQERSL